MLRILTSFVFAITVLFSLTLAAHSYSKDTSNLNAPPSLLSNEIDVDVRSTIRNTTNALTCSANSPIHKIKYNFTHVSQIKNADFCHQYTSRTCCSMDNLNQLRVQLYRMLYMNQDLSNQCQQALHQLVCYDCDGDVGQGIRKGICVSQCENLFNICKDDYFVIDQTTLKIKVCQQSDLICSKLSDIVTQKSDFCNLLGYEVNTHSEYSDWFYQFYDEGFNNNTSNINSAESNLLSKGVQPICWDFTPSQYIFGSAQNVATVTSEASTKQSNSSFFDSNSTLLKVLTYIGYALLGFIVIVGLMYIQIAWKQCKLKATTATAKNKERGGVRIGGSSKNPYKEQLVD